jgi:hypothetical protein
MRGGVAPLIVARSQQEASELTLIKSGRGPEYALPEARIAMFEPWPGPYQDLKLAENQLLRNLNYTPFSNLQ